MRAAHATDERGGNNYRYQRAIKREQEEEEYRPKVELRERQKQGLEIELEKQAKIVTFKNCDMRSYYHTKCVQLEAQKKEDPFFLYLAYNAPHSPIQPPEEWVDKVKNREPGISDKRARFVALTEHMDYGIGQVVQSLKDNGIYDDTLVIFTSDNGGSLRFGSDNGPLRDQKGTVYEGGLRVPAAVVWNNKIQARSSSKHTGMTMDIFPTIMDICGIDWEGPIDGVSFAPVLSGGSVDVFERAMIFSRREGGLAYNGKTIEAVRIGDFKLVHNSPYEPYEMYNIAQDPYEKKNLLEGKKSDQFSKVPHFTELRARLALHFQQRGSVPWQPPKE